MSIPLMQEKLMHNLWQYIGENNPDLLIQLNNDRELTLFLSGKLKSISATILRTDLPDYLLEQLCMDALTKDLRPSKFNYVCALLQEEFETTFWELKENGSLKLEAINIVAYCQSLFDALHFSEANENSKLLHYAVAGAIVEYFDRSGNETETARYAIEQPVLA